MKTQPTLVFGASTTAALLAWHLEHDADADIVGFALDAEFQRGSTYEERPVRTLQEWAEVMPPESVQVLVPIVYRWMNGLRIKKVEEARALGFRIGTYVSSRALLPLGAPFQARPNTIIYEGCIVQAYAEVGENVILRAGANIGHHSKVGDHSFIATGVTTGGAVTIGERCFVGIGAVIRDSVTLAPGTFVGAGAVVTRDTEPDGVYVGVPAKRREGVSALEMTS